jgi:uncharacterized protein (UPF0335 family)
MIDGEALKGFVERGKSIKEAQKELAEELKDLCAEADEAGVCSKRELRQLCTEAMKDPDILVSHLERMNSLRQALGRFADEPLGKAAMQAASKPMRGPGRPRKNAAQQALNGSSNTPDIETEREQALVDPYKSGREAALHGFNESRNPFDAGSLVGDEWIEGFRVGETERTGDNGSAPAA